MKVCICCSSKLFPIIGEFMGSYQGNKYEFLPPDLNFTGENNLANRRKLALDHLEKIRESDAIYIYNPEGMIGKGVNAEIGQAAALGKKIIAHQKIGDLGLDCFVDEYIKMEEL